MSLISNYFSIVGPGTLTLSALSSLLGKIISDWQCLLLRWITVKPTNPNPTGSYPSRALLTFTFLF